MNKVELKKKWFKYCDTDKLVSDMCDLFDTYRHEYTEHGVCTLLDTYFKQKEPLIKMFIKSKNYIGNMRIVMEKEFDRAIDSHEIYKFFSDFHNAVGSIQLLREKDDDGNRMFDYLVTNSNAIDIDNLPNGNEQNSKLEKLHRFDYEDQTTIESHNKYNQFNRYVNYFSELYHSTIQRDYTADSTCKNVPLLKKGTKASRAFNAVCVHYGVDKFNPEVTTVERNGKTTEKTIYPYNKLLAEYSDLVSDLKRKMSFVISLNPLDYLTMSFGVSWISCHNISHGGWKAGCLSYMLDRTSMVTFVINKTDEPIHNIPKLYRQMYHYEDNLFIQNRLYPQGNDGATNLYDQFRSYIIEEFTDIMDVDCTWSVNTGVQECCAHIHSEGSHYRDYNGRNDCSIFYPSNKASDIAAKVMTIGHKSICIKCGKPFTVSNRLNHQFTRECMEAQLL